MDSEGLMDGLALMVGLAELLVSITLGLLVSVPAAVTMNLELLVADGE